MPCHEEAIDQLRDAGHRLTPQRAMVLDAVYHQQGHMTAEEIYAAVHRKSPYVDLSTVYRTLLFLRQNRLIAELRLEGEPVRYEAVRSGREHHHAVCQGCGAMQEIDAGDLGMLDDLLVRKYGFRVDLVHLTLTGLCADCAGKQDG